MAQESTMICVDNSDWMRNGDFAPTRLSCMQEAVRALINYKLRSNPENAVGLLTMAKRIDVLSSLTTEDRKLMVRLHSIEITGTAMPLAGTKTAYLALKHRKNRNHRQRIVVFLGSPLDPLLKESDEFIKFAKKLKKEKVNVDFVLFGEAVADENRLVVDFINTLNGTEGGGSHLLVVPVGETKLFQALLGSPICEGAGAGAMANGDFNEDEDPELAMALRISLEEQRLRQQQQQNQVGAAPAAAGEQQQGGGGAAAVEAMEVDQQAQAAGGAAVQEQKQAEPDFAALSEEQQLEYALRLSMADNEGGKEQASQQQDLKPAQQSRSPTGAMSTPAPTPMETEEGGSGQASGSAGAAAGGVQLGDLLAHPEMLKQLVNQMPAGSGGATQPQQPSQESSKNAKEEKQGTDKQKKDDEANKKKPKDPKKGDDEGNKDKDAKK